MMNRIAKDGDANGESQLVSWKSRKNTIVIREFLIDFFLVNWLDQLRPDSSKKCKINFNLNYLLFIFF